MTYKSEPATLAFLLPKSFDSQRQSRVEGCESFHVSLVAINAQDKPRNLSDGSFYEDDTCKTYDRGLANFGAYVWISDREPMTPNVTLEWRECHSVDFAQAERMAKVARRIRAKLDKLGDTLGCARGADQILIRYCMALGVKHVIQQTSDERGWSYDDHDFRIMSHVVGGDALVALCQAAYDSMPKAAKAAA